MIGGFSPPRIPENRTGLAGTERGAGAWAGPAKLALAVFFRTPVDLFGDAGGFTGAAA